MALSRIGTAIADTTSVTIPAGHQVGDWIFIYAFRAATGAPSLPAGWTSIASTSSGASSHLAGYKIATSGAETSGTWTNASGLMCIVMRGQTTNKQPSPTGGFGFAGGTTGTSSTLNFATLTIQQKDVWWIAFAAQKTTANDLSTPPAGLTLQANTNGASNEYAIYDSNGLYPHDGSWPSTNVSVGATSAEYRTFCTPLFPEQLSMQNYMSVKGGDGLSFGERIR